MKSLRAVVVILVSLFVITGTCAALRNDKYENDMSEAQRHYLKGNQYLKQGNKEAAFESWQKSMAIVQQFPENMKLQTKFAFLFGRDEKLTGAEKKKRYDKFKATFQSLATHQKAVLAKEQQSKLNEAARMNIEAERKRRLAEVQQQVTDQKRSARLQGSNNRIVVERRDSGGSVNGFLIVIGGVVFLGLAGGLVWYFFAVRTRRTDEQLEHQHELAIAQARAAEAAFTHNPVDAQIDAALRRSDPASQNSGSITSEFARRSRGRPDVQGGAQRRPSQRIRPTSSRSNSGNRVAVHKYNVPSNDLYYVGGPFWYDGVLYPHEAAFYAAWGYHYTNMMYLDNYLSHHRSYYDPQTDDMQGDMDAFESALTAAVEYETEALHLEQDAAELKGHIEAIDSSLMELEVSEASDFNDDPGATSDTWTVEPDEEDPIRARDAFEIPEGPTNWVDDSPAGEPDWTEDDSSADSDWDDDC